MQPPSATKPADEEQWMKCRANGLRVVVSRSQGGTKYEGWIKADDVEDLLCRLEERVKQLQAGAVVAQSELDALHSQWESLLSQQQSRPLGR